MTAHELANKLLEGPDLPVVVEDCVAGEWIYAGYERLEIYPEFIHIVSNQTPEFPHP